MTIGRLIPVPSQLQIMSPGVDRLPEIYFSSRNETIRLGRNGITKISDSSLSRRECTMTVLNDGMIAITDAKNVFVNGKYVPNDSTTILQNGDKVSLYDNRYSYTVRYTAEQNAGAITQAMGDTPQTKPSPRKRNAPSATLGSSGNSVLPKEVIEELNCSLCLELQVEPVAVIPCGHSFCKSCAKKVTECPNCRGKIRGVVPNLSFANIISGLATTSLLPYEDVLAYDERIPAQKRVQRKCGRSEDDAILID